MKYIRTENKIIKAKKNKWNELVDKQGKYIAELEIIAQADTIEELCDRFYWDREDWFSIHNFMSYPVAKDIWDEYVKDCLEDNEKPDKNMYGCIKTPKGLIYVAKMNSDGVLELI